MTTWKKKQNFSWNTKSIKFFTSFWNIPEWLAGDEVIWLNPLRLPGVLASKQQIGVNCKSFSAPRPWMSGCRIVDLWLGKKAVWGIRCLNINHSITSSQLRPTKVSKNERVTVESCKTKLKISFIFPWKWFFFSSNHHLFREIAISCKKM